MIFNPRPRSRRSRVARKRRILNRRDSSLPNRRAGPTVSPTPGPSSPVVGKTKLVGGTGDPSRKTLGAIASRRSMFNRVKPAGGRASRRYGRG